MAVTIVQHKTSGGSGGATMTVTVTATGAGNLLVVGVEDDGASTVTVTGVSDGTSAFTQVPSARATNTNNNVTDVWYLASSNAGKTTITASLTGATGTGVALYFWEVSGITSPSPNGAAVVSNGTGAAGTYTGASLTPSAPQFLVGLIGTTSGAAITQNPKTGNEFTAGGDIDASGWTTSAGCALITTSATAHQPVWLAGTTAVSFCASTVAFQGTGGGGGGAFRAFYGDSPRYSGQT